RRRLIQPVTDGAVHPVPLWADPDGLPPVVRSRPERRPFRWLWLGGADCRKGHREVIAAWDRAFLGREGCELYLKTVRSDRRVLQAATVIEDSLLRDDPPLGALYGSGAR